MATQAEKAKSFRKLHVPGEPLVLFNIWDPGSAKVVAETAAMALATSSWAVSVASGYSDGEHTPLPLAIDNLAIKAGAIGCNLEDSFPENGSLREIKQQVDRIRHARQKTKETDVDFFINARTDVFIHVPQDQHDAPLVAQALERAQAYAEAGADGLFVPGLANLALIGDLAKASPLPVNIMVNEGTNIRALATRGVARVSFGAAPYILMMTALREATQRAILK